MHGTNSARKATGEGISPPGTVQSESVHTAPVWAVPSWVRPGTVAENCRFLRGRADHVALCLFESAACLAYGPGDLPDAELASSFDFHLHLPVDLPWEETQAGKRTGDARSATLASAGVCVRLARLCASLRPLFAVLHPPAWETEVSVSALERFLDVWSRETGLPLLLENTAQAPVRDLLDAAPQLFAKGGCGLCLDLGHLLRYDPHRLLRRCARPDASSLVRAVHWNLPGPGGRHLPLAGTLPPGVESAVRSVLALVPGNCIHVLELFDWDACLATRDTLSRLMAAPS